MVTSKGVPLDKPITQNPTSLVAEWTVPSVCQFRVIVLWKRRRRTWGDSDCPRHGLEVLVRSYAVGRGRVEHVPIHLALGRANMTSKVDAGIVALWKGGLIRHGVGGGGSISIEYAFRNLHKVPSFGGMSGVADIWY